MLLIPVGNRSKLGLRRIAAEEGRVGGVWRSSKVQWMLSVTGRLPRSRFRFILPAVRLFVCMDVCMNHQVDTQIPRLSTKLNSCQKYPRFSKTCIPYSRDCLVSHVNPLSQPFSREIKPKYLPAPPNIDNLCKGV